MPQKVKNSLPRPFTAISRGMLTALEAAKGGDNTFESLVDAVLTGDFAGALSSPFGASLLLDGATEGEDFDGEPSHGPRIPLWFILPISIRDGVWSRLQFAVDHRHPLGDLVSPSTDHRFVGVCRIRFLFQFAAALQRVAARVRSLINAAEEEEAHATELSVMLVGVASLMLFMQAI